MNRVLNRVLNRALNRAAVSRAGRNRVVARVVNRAMGGGARHVGIQPHRARRSIGDRQRPIVTVLALLTLMPGAAAQAQGSASAAGAADASSALATMATTAATTTAGTATQMALFTPYVGGGLSVGIAVTDTLQGSCFAPSIASPERPDAWRCSAGNAIMDPCFVDPRVSETQLACAADPFSANVTLLDLEAPLSTERMGGTPDYRDAAPWALELENGQRCVSMTGATGLIAGLRINYGCPDGAVVAGGLDRTSAVWTVFFQSAMHTKALRQVAVRTAWY